MINEPIPQGEFTIQLQGSGFRMSPNIAGKVATFWVVNPTKNIRSMFVFATSLTDFFENPTESEDEILNSAIELIKKRIDLNQVEDLEEYVYEYKSHRFIENQNPRWWDKTLKANLSK